MLGGNEALTTLSSSAGSSNEEVKDAAIRACRLAGLPRHQALLVVASDPHSTRVQSVLAVQAVARLVKSADAASAAARLKRPLSLNLASRDEEKKLLLSAFGSVQDAKAGEALKGFWALPVPAGGLGGGVKLAEALRKTDKPAARDLAQAIKDAAISDERPKRTDATLKRN